MIKVVKVLFAVFHVVLVLRLLVVLWLSFVKQAGKDGVDPGRVDPLRTQAIHNTFWRYE